MREVETTECRRKNLLTRGGAESVGGGVKSAGGGAGITGFGGKRLFLRLHFRLCALLLVHRGKSSGFHKSHENLLFAAYYTTNHPPTATTGLCKVRG